MMGEGSGSVLTQSLVEQTEGESYFELQVNGGVQNVGQSEAINSTLTPPSKCNLFIVADT